MPQYSEIILVSAANSSLLKALKVTSSQMYRHFLEIKKYVFHNISDRTNLKINYSMHIYGCEPDRRQVVL